MPGASDTAINKPSPQEGAGESPCSESRIPDPTFASRVFEIVTMLRNEMAVSVLREAYLEEQYPPNQDIAQTAREMACSARTLATLLNDLIRLFDLE